MAYFSHKMLAQLAKMVNNDCMTGIVNKDLLKRLVESAGGPVVVAYEADVGHSTLEKMLAGTYSSFPRKKLRDKLCAFFKVKETLLFPFVSADGLKKAS